MGTYAELINRDLPLVERGCTSKVRFESRGEANSLARQGRHSDGAAKPYRCEYCGAWHLGHNRSRKARHARSAGRWH